MRAGKSVSQLVSLGVEPPPAGQAFLVTGQSPLCQAIYTNVHFDFLVTCIFIHTRVYPEVSGLS
jgi:hypothetical protein